MAEQQAVCADKLCYSFGTGWELKELTFTVLPGQVFGLLGTNGAGKTTTIRLLTGQLKPHSGTVSILGVNPLQDAQRLRRLVGVMQEDPGHYQRLSVRKNLRFFASLYGTSAEYADELLKKVDLEHKANSPVSALSRGLRQRLALARAMVGQPKLLFLDEPTSGLDPVAAGGVRHLIASFCKNGGTVFLTTHYMEEAEKLCHQVGILHQGTLLCQGHYLDLCQQYLPEQVEVEQGGRLVKRAPGLEELFYHFTGRRIN
ncbi:MAG: ABC transporter ATP-binding protein [bacterium]|nr:ABC transporter ATP-binding protein [bacterium]